jgi:hypothetical protein
MSGLNGAVRPSCSYSFPISAGIRKNVTGAMKK